MATTGAASGNKEPSKIQFEAGVGTEIGGTEEQYVSINGIDPDGTVHDLTYSHYDKLPTFDVSAGLKSNFFQLGRWHVSAAGGLYYNAEKMRSDANWGSSVEGADEQLVTQERDRNTYTRNRIGSYGTLEVGRKGFGEDAKFIESRRTGKSLVDLSETPWGFRASARVGMLWNDNSDHEYYAGGATTHEVGINGDEITTFVDTQFRLGTYVSWLEAGVTWEPWGMQHPLNPDIGAQDKITLGGTEYAPNILTDGIPGLVRQTGGNVGVYLGARFAFGKKPDAARADTAVRASAVRAGEEAEAAALLGTPGTGE